MDPVLRHKALAAAASVVLALGSGCRAVASTDPDTDRVVDTEVSDTDVADTDVADTDVADTDPADTDAAAPDCVNAADVGACCMELATWCDLAYAGDPDAINECVYGPNYDGSTGCIPWGPPTPPEASYA